MQVCPENIENTAFAYKNRSGNIVQCYLTAVIIVNILHHYLKLSLRPVSYTHLTLPTKA